MKGLFIAAAIARVACAMVDPKPQVTDSVAMKELGLERGFTPRPTTAPMHRDLLRRQAATDILGYLAPDNTCGYVDGRIGGVKTCDTTENCAAILGTDAFYTMGCCGAAACTMMGACYDYASRTACDHACEQDANIVKCESAYPYCYGYSVPGMSMGFYSCDTSTALTFDAFETTYAGETGAQTWLALRESDFSSLLASEVPETIATGTTGGFSLTNTANTAGSGTRTATSGPQTSTSDTPEIIDQDDDGSSTPIGAIVGGVVGGVAVLGAIVGAIVFFLLKKKKKNTPPAAGSAPGNDPHMSQYGAPNAPPSGPGYYQPPNGAAAGYFGPGKTDAEAKYGQPMVTESNLPGVTPVSPAPAYSMPVQQGGAPSQYAPSPAGSPPPQSDPRYSSVSQAYPPQGYPSPQQPGYAPQPPYAQQPAAPVELGNTYAVPSQRQGQPVYEAA